MVNLGVNTKIYGAQVGARVFEKAVEGYVDPLYTVPLGVAGTPPSRLSTYINVAGGILLPMLNQKFRLISDETAQVIGGHLFSTVVDDALEMFPLGNLAAGSAVRRSFQQVASRQYVAPPSPSYYPTSGSGISDVSIKNPIQNGGRYARA